MDSNRLFLRKADSPLQAKIDYPLAKTEPHVSTLVGKLLQQDPTKITPADLSTHHYVYSIPTASQGYYLKIPKTYAAAKTLRVEESIYARLRSYGHKGVEIIKADHSCQDVPFPYLFMTEASGVCLRSLDIDRPDFNQFVVAVSDQMAKIHALVLPQGTEGYGLLDGDILEKSNRWHGAYGSWDKYILSHLKEHLAYALEYEVITSAQSLIIEQQLKSICADFSDIKTCLLHGDLGTHNIFVDEDTHQVSSIIDWEDVLLGDPLFDIAMFSTFYRMEEFAEILLNNYVKATALSKEKLWYRFWAYHLRIALAKSVLRYKLGYDKTKGQSTMTPKIRRALMELESM